jgi:hypothetical protein
MAEVVVLVVPRRARMGPSRRDPAPAVCLGFGRIVASEKDLPNTLAKLVLSG